MHIRVQLDSLPRPALPQGLVGHRFDLVGGVETFNAGTAREYTMDMARLADEAAAAAFVQGLAPCMWVEFVLYGGAPIEGFVANRRVVLLDEHGVVVDSFLG